MSTDERVGTIVENIDRRYDLGSKLKDGVISIILSLFIFTVWGTATSAREQGLKNAQDIAVIRTQWSSVIGDLQEIKDILRRGVPDQKFTGR